LKQAQGVAQFMNCALQDAIKLAKEDGDRFNEVVMIVRAENLIDAQLQRERQRANGR
jgi:hypothetical protein